MKEGFVFKVSQGESQTTRLFFLHDHGEATREPLYLHNCIPVAQLCHQAPLSKTEQGVCPGRSPECLTWFAQHSGFSLQQRGHLAVVHLEGFWNVCSIPGLHGSGVWRTPVLFRGKTSLPTGGEFLQPAVHLSGAVPGLPGCSWSRTCAFPVHGLHPGGSVCLDCDPVCPFLPTRCHSEWPWDPANPPAWVHPLIFFSNHLNLHTLTGLYFYSGTLPARLCLCGHCWCFPGQACIQKNTGIKMSSTNSYPASSGGSWALSLVLEALSTI